MSTIKDMNISSGILFPKLVNKFQVQFNAEQDFTILTLQTVSVSTLVQARAGLQRISITVQDDIIGQTQAALQELWKLDSFGITVEHLDGNNSVINTYELTGCKVDQISHGALDYAGGTKSPKLTLSTKNWMGPAIDDLTENLVAAAVVTLLNGATVVLSDPELDSPTCVEHELSISFEKLTVTGRK